MRWRGGGEWVLVNFDKLKRKELFVNMSMTIIITKLKTIQWIMLQHTITKRLEICIDVNIEIS